MKVSPRRDYPVGVRPMSAEAPAEVAGLYEGIYEVTLNNVVDVVFCPAVAAPLRDDLLPRDVDEITDSTQARLVSILFSRYCVTPSEALAGKQERLPGGAVVYYVAEADFAVYAAELRDLSGRYPDEAVTELTGHAVIRFLQDTVIPSPLFDAADRAMLQQDGDGDHRREGRGVSQ